MSPNFNKKEVLEILCLKKIIASKAPTVPPKKETVKSVFSEILRRCFSAFLLSAPYIIKVKRLMAVKK